MTLAPGISFPTEEVTRICRRYRVNELSVFGSAARGELRRASDLDLIVVQRTERRFLDRLDEIYRLLTPKVACDILVYTPEEFTRLQQERRFVARAVREGRLLYEA